MSSIQNPYCHVNIKNCLFQILVFLINHLRFVEFIYFAKNMEEIRKKWLQSELKCKELENKFNLEKSILQRKINELK
jgi:hypothetical protein